MQATIIAIIVGVPNAEASLMNPVPTDKKKIVLNKNHKNSEFGLHSASTKSLQCSGCV